MKACEWTFFVWLVTAVSQVCGDTKILIREPSPKGPLWRWPVYKASEGAGWNVPTNGRKYYSVCDVGTAKEPINWIYTDFIPLEDAKLLDIVMQYGLRNCPKSSGGHCKRYLSLYTFHTDKALSAAPIPTHGNYQFAAKIMPKTLPKTYAKYIYHGKLETKAKGIYLGFLDQGACISIDSVTIGYRYCSKKGPTLVEFTRTVAPANDSRLVEQSGMCSDPNSISSEKLSGVCLSSGEWNITDGLKCLCKEGYELLNESESNSLECRGCQRGFYKSTVSNTRKCVECPANSSSNIERTGCTCGEGFHKWIPEAPCKEETLSPSEGGVSTQAPKSQAGSVFDKEKLLHAVYISVIVVMFIVVLTMSVVLWRMRRRLEVSKLRRERESPKGEGLIPMVSIAVQGDANTQPLNEGPRVDPQYATPALGRGDYMSLHPSTRSWETHREQVNIVKVIGKGAFSEVAKATAWNIRDNQEYITVAAKMLKANAPESDRKDLLSELELMKKLKPHPHVIRLIGCVTESEPLLVLIEFVPFGDLLGYLRKNRGLNDTYFNDPDVKPQTNLTAEQLMRFAWQVADGMCYLSSKKIIHRDLAARNVLVGEGEKCKVTDFGMARNLDQEDIYARKSRGRLPVKWTAYEALMFGTYTTQSDVWSYGILLYEIVTIGGSPYPGINTRQIAEKLQGGYRMPKPAHVDEKLYQIMMKCWEEKPTNRPTFEKLRNTMREIERKHRTYINMNQYDDSLYANVSDLEDD